MAGKDPEHFVCPPSHVAAIKEWGKDCMKVLVVGASGRDDNLLNLLNATLTRPGLVRTVGGQDVSQCAERFRHGVRAIKDAMRHDWHAAGFRGYLQSPAFDAFLGWTG